MKEILVTGVTGFVGGNLIEYLKAGKIFQAIAFNRCDGNQSFISIDPKIEAIVHLAGKAHDLKNVAHPEEYYKVNTELTKRLYDAFLVSSAKKFIFVSSVKAAADEVIDILDEDFIPNPQTHYGKSKLMAEEYIRKQPLPEGKKYYILRPCMIHGPGNKGNLNMLYNFVKTGIPFPLAAFPNKRSFLSVENMCYVINEFLKRNDVLSGTYNVADDEPLSTNEVVEILAKSLNQKARMWYISSGIIKKVAKLGDVFKLPLSSERLQKLTENYIVSNVKIKDALHIVLPQSSKEGLSITANSFKVTDRS